MPVDRDQRRRVGQRLRGVLVADDAHHAAGAPERLDEAHADAPRRFARRSDAPESSDASTGSPSCRGCCAVRLRLRDLLASGWGRQKRRELSVNTASACNESTRYNPAADRRCRSSIMRQCPRPRKIRAPAPAADVQFDIGARRRRHPHRMTGPVRPLRRHLPFLFARATRRHVGHQPPRRRQARAGVEPQELHQGLGAGPRQDPARPRHHDQRRRPVETPALHDAALRSTAASSPNSRSSSTPATSASSPMGSAGRARRARQRHRRHERAHARDRAAVDFRHRPRAAREGVRQQPVRHRHQGNGARSQVRVPIPPARQAGGRARQAPPRGEDRALRFPADAHGCARQGNRRAHVRARAHRRGHDAHRRRPRNHRERPQLDLVPAVAEPARPKRCCTPKSTPPPSKPSPASRTWKQLSYTKNVVDEALRLYPPGWLLSRRTIAPDVLSGLRRARRHRRAAQPLSTAPAPALLEGAGRVPARAIRRGARKRTPALRLHAVCRGPAPLHR